MYYERSRLDFLFQNLFEIKNTPFSTDLYVELESIQFYFFFY